MRRKDLHHLTNDLADGAADIGFGDNYILIGRIQGHKAELALCFIHNQLFAVSFAVENENSDPAGINAGRRTDKDGDPIRDFRLHTVAGNADAEIRAGRDKSGRELLNMEIRLIEIIPKAGSGGLIKNTDFREAIAPPGGFRQVQHRFFRLGRRSILRLIGKITAVFHPRVTAGLVETVQNG